MKTVEVVETHVGELKEFNWLTYVDENGESQFVEDADDAKIAAAVLGLTPAAVEAIRDALQFMAQSLIDELEKDLADIWEVAND